MWSSPTREAMDVLQSEYELKQQRLQLRQQREDRLAAKQGCCKNKLPDFKIELLPGGMMPTKANPTDAGWDCYSNMTGWTKGGFTTIPIPLGFKLEIPEGWQARLKGRSGLAARGIVAHCGTIDHLYRDEVKLILHISPEISTRFEFKAGERLCQMTFEPVYNNQLVQVDKITPTDRGGFGSTGK